MNSYNRREFLGASFALAATTRLVPGQTPVTEAPRKITVGFLGTGYSHFRDKHALISAGSDWRLVGLCEEDAAVRAKGPEGARWLSAEQLCAEAEVVVVESAVKDHARDARRALLANRHVHVEKPPADTLAGLRELIRLAGDRKRLLQIGYMWRYNPGLNAALAAARRSHEEANNLRVFFVWLRGQKIRFQITIHLRFGHFFRDYCNGLLPAA